MAFFGLFGDKTSPAALKKHIERVANKRAQDVDRWASIQTLAKAQTPEAIRGLLARFTFYVDSSITDQEEKDAAFAAIIEAGERAVEPVKESLRRSDSIAWPLKLLDALCTQEQVNQELIALLNDMDTEYERDPQRKLDLLAALGERPDPRSHGVLERFLEDTNETARFNAVGSLLAQADLAASCDPLLGCYEAEESLRIRNRILEGLAERQAVVPEARRAALQGKLPAHITMDAAGVLHKK